VEVRGVDGAVLCDRQGLTGPGCGHGGKTAVREMSDGINHGSCECSGLGNMVLQVDFGQQARGITRASRGGVDGGMSVSVIDCLGHSDDGRDNHLIVKTIRFWSLWAVYTSCLRVVRSNSGICASEGSLLSALPLAIVDLSL
jgi:hypothetical protein